MSANDSSALVPGLVFLNLLINSVAFFVLSNLVPITPNPAPITKSVPETSACLCVTAAVPATPTPAPMAAVGPLYATVV